MLDAPQPGAEAGCARRISAGCSLGHRPQPQGGAGDAAEGHDAGGTQEVAAQRVIRTGCILELVVRHNASHQLAIAW
ncbi:hypothetical protein D9M68_887180 [compost metagenome]